MPRTRAKANKVKSLPAAFHLRKISEKPTKNMTHCLPEQGLGMTDRHYQGGREGKREGGSTDQYWVGKKILKYIPCLGQHPQFYYPV